MKEFEIIEVWAIFNSEKEKSWRVFYTDIDHAKDRCKELNDGRPFLHLSKFVIKERNFS